jgi:hypothetical protein
MTISAKKRNTWPMMQKTFLLLIFNITVNSLAGPTKLSQILGNNNLKKKHEKILLKGDLISSVNMNSLPGKKQDFKFSVLGLHPHSCQRALRKISQYQEYKNYIDFVKESQYDENLKMIFLEIKSPIIPKTFYLHFEIPRIQEPGSYAFSFKKGFLKDLNGKIEVIQTVSNRCFLKMNGTWIGPSTPFPNLIFELFSQTILKMGLKRLIRMSSV